jgi:hypothetical protein
MILTKKHIEFLEWVHNNCWEVISLSERTGLQMARFEYIHVLDTFRYMKPKSYPYPYPWPKVHSTRLDVWQYTFNELRRYYLKEYHRHITKLNQSTTNT